MLFNFEKISYTYVGSPAPVLHDCSFAININSRIGLIGDNGCGKSTLLQIIMGELGPDAGYCNVSDGLILYLVQDKIFGNVKMSVLDWFYSLNPRLEKVRYRLREIEGGEWGEAEQLEYAELAADFQDAGAWTQEAEFIKSLLQMGFTEEIQTRFIDTLSGGELQKVALAGILSRQADLLLLDEPGNHLDAEAFDWLLHTLQAIKVPFVLVSHDRALLDECCNQICRLEGGTLKIRQGNYSTFIAEEEAEKNFREESRVRILGKIKSLQQSAQKRRQEGEAMENFKSSRSVAKNGRVCKRDDGDGNGRSRLSERKMKSAIVLERKMEKMQEEAAELKNIVRKAPVLHLQNTCLRTCTLLSLSDCSVQIGACKIDFPDIHLGPGDRLLLSGPNGSGKTSLLLTVLGKLKPFRGRVYVSERAKIAWFSQDAIEMDGRISPYDWLLSTGAKQEIVCRSLGALRLSEESWHRQIVTLSPGERSKLALAECLCAQADILLLDEPCNHLEIAARESLEGALSAFNGAIILVSHDRRFGEIVCNSFIQISGSA
jgi:ATP-binding cassette subfamily F protein 3